MLRKTSQKPGSIGTNVPITPAAIATISNQV